MTAASSPHPSVSLRFTRLPSSALRVTGADCVDFVQGQMTNDIRSAAVPSVLPAAFLNVKGQMQQFAYIYRREGDIYIHLAEGHAAPLAERFARYIIFDQVEVSDLSAELRTLHLWDGWPVLGGLPTQAEAHTGQAWDVPLAPDVRVLCGAVNRTGALGLDLHFLAHKESEVLATLGGLGATDAPLDLLHAARVEAGIPDPVADGFLGLLPQEVGLDVGGPLPAISYRKGCYVGQEIMARLEARGKARYELRRVNLFTHSPLKGESSASLAARGGGTGTSEAGAQVGTPLVADGKTIGQLGMPAGGLALARVRRDLPEGAELTCAGHPLSLLPPNHA